MSNSANVSAQSWFHIGKGKRKKRKKNKKNKPTTFTLTFVLSHSPTSQMQTPMSSEEAAHPPAPHLSITAKDVAVSVDEMDSE